MVFQIRLGCLDRFDVPLLSITTNDIGVEERIFLGRLRSM